MDDPKKEQADTDTKKSVKGQRKGRAQINRDGRNKGGKDIAKTEDEPESVIEKAEPPKNFKEQILQWMDHRIYVTTMIIVTVLALFMIDIVSRTSVSIHQPPHPI